ncbi:keratin, type II cytoskeletal 2 epidermal [Anabrus simplex]|uniref:keratin, type II cytoskeletal 2 epidermal n=1 Tax=Anabrus simplex TaxID=316456 RepID=UPI0035A3CA65
MMSLKHITELSRMLLVFTVFCGLVQGQTSPGISTGSAGVYFAPQVEHSGQLARLSAATANGDKEPSAASNPQEPAIQQNFGFSQGFPQSSGLFHAQPFNFGGFTQGSGFGSQPGLLSTSPSVASLGQAGTAADTATSVQGSTTGSGLPFGQQAHQFGSFGGYNGFSQNFGPIASRYTELNGVGSSQGGSSSPQVSSGSVIGFYGNAPPNVFPNPGFGALPGQITGGPFFPGFGFSGGYSGGAVNSGGAVTGGSESKSDASSNTANNGGVA